ncbi:cyclase family protein [Diaminobutyricibacter sp. McL0618]|uniref:cyclase family protein n=1 Tax=Leifsonia sp. McL0618 TaxID=3415677 RepID=UPI003CFB6FCA
MSNGEPMPKYAELPIVDGGRSGWHVFGSADQVGRLNLQTPARVAAAAALVRSGEVFPLDASLTAFDPPMFGRGPARHSLIDGGTECDFDDQLDEYNPQASSQWDSLAHVGFAPNVFYNGTTADEVRRGERNTIDHWARRGIAGRAVVIDIDAVYRARSQDYNPGETTRITVGDLEEARTIAGVAWEPGDVMLLHTGYLAWYAHQGETAKQAMADPDTDNLTSVGLDRGSEMLEYLWDSGISAIVADNPAVEAMPFDVSDAAWPNGFMHHRLIGQLGFALGELWSLADLARACRTDGRYTALLASAPNNIPGAVSSPANALAIR